MPSLMGVDVLGLLSYWGDEVGSGRLWSQVPTLTSRKAFSVEKDHDRRLFPRCTLSGGHGSGHLYLGAPIGARYSCGSR